jgi:hypothetical protein
MPKAVGRTQQYASIIAAIFERHYREGLESFDFDRSEIADAAQRLGVPLPKNVGDVIYSFRYRRPLPESITSHAPEGKEWVIRLAGRSRYRFALTAVIIRPNPMLVQIRVPDATPGVVSMYALSDEQALLAKLRYNRLIDIFTGVTCYSLQNHLRTTVSGMGQVETDEVYVGVDKRGAHYVLPVQAKGGTDMLSVVQVEQDAALCAEKFPGLVCRPVAAQFMEEGVIALFEFVKDEGEFRISEERHYQLVPHEELTEDDLRAYRAQQPM